MSIKSKMTAIADRIRSLLGVTSKLTLDDIVSNLDVCQSEVNAQSDLLDLALLTINDKAISGTIPANPILQSKSVVPSEEGQTVVAENGYDGLSSVYVEAIDKMYIGSGVAKKNTETYIPKVSYQTILKNQFLIGDQTIAGDHNLIPENIRNNVEIFGVVGTYNGNEVSNNSATVSTGTFVPSTDLSSYTIRHNLGKKPIFCIVFATGNISAIDFENYMVWCSILAHCQYGSSVFDDTSQKMQTSQWMAGTAYGNLRNYSSGSVDNNTPISDSEVAINFAKLKSGVQYNWVCVAADSYL